MEIVDCLDNVNDRESFILFARELIKDREIGRKAENENLEKNKIGMLQIGKIKQ